MVKIIVFLAWLAFVYVAFVLPPKLGVVKGQGPVVAAESEGRRWSFTEYCKCYCNGSKLSVVQAIERQLNEVKNAYQRELEAKAARNSLPNDAKAKYEQVCF